VASKEEFIQLMERYKELALSGITGPFPIGWLGSLYAADLLLGCNAQHLSPEDLKEVYDTEVYKEVIKLYPTIEKKVEEYNEQLLRSTR